MAFFGSMRLITLSASLLVLGACGGNSVSNTAPSASPSPMSSAMSHHGGKAKININNAILSELDKLEAKLGVPALSNRIQASRPYANVEELVTKKVLTQAQLEQVKEMITIEDIVLVGEPKDVDYMTKMGLMKGHLIVAKELLVLKKPEQAEPHIGHPVEEIYADVEDQLSERKIGEFKSGLITLQDLVKSKTPDQTKLDTQFKSSIKDVDGAIAALPATVRQSPKFILQVINGLLDTANSEYGSAVLNRKISAAIEYQDSRGFVIYADQLYQEIAPKIEKTNPAAHKTLQTTLTELKTVWPSVLPPAVPVKTPEKVAVLIKSFEQVSNQISQEK